MPIFRAIWTISSLSIPTTGRRMGRSTTAPVTSMASMVWLATLAQALTGDQGLSPAPPGHLLGDAHHEAAHDDGEQLLRAGAAQLLLDGGEGHHVDGEPPGPGVSRRASSSTFSLASREV